MGSSEQQAGGHAVGQHEPHGGGQGGQDRRGQRMARGCEPHSEHVHPGRDGEEAEHSVRGPDIGRHAGTEKDQPDQQGRREHDEPGRRDGEQRP